MNVAQHRGEGKLVLVITDSNLQKTVCEEGNTRLDFTSAFYKGNELLEKDIVPLLDQAAIIHAAGKETLLFLKKNGYPVEGARTVAAIPFIQIVIE